MLLYVKQCACHTSPLPISYIVLICTSEQYACAPVQDISFSTHTAYSPLLMIICTYTYYDRCMYLSRYIRYQNRYSYASLTFKWTQVRHNYLLNISYTHIGLTPIHPVPIQLERCTDLESHVYLPLGEIQKDHLLALLDKKIQIGVSLMWPGFADTLSGDRIPETVVAGPPFSVTPDKLHRHYGDSYPLAPLARIELLNGLKGKCPATEHVWRLNRQ